MYIIFNEGSLKRKSETIDLSNINRPHPKTLNFASSTPTLVTANKLPVTTISEYITFNFYKNRNRIVSNYYLYLKFTL